MGTVHDLPTWADTPRRTPVDAAAAPPAPHRIHPALQIAAMLVVAGAVPVQRSVWVAGSLAGLTIAAVVVVCVLALRRFGDRVWGWFGPVAAGMVAAWAVAGPQLSFWTGAGLVLAAWGSGTPPPRLPVAIPPPVTLAPLAVGALFAMLRSRSEFGWRLPVLFVVLGVATILVLTRWPDLPHTIGRLVAGWLSAVLFGALGLFVIVLPAAVRALIPGRWRRRGDRSGWSGIVRSSHTPDRPWSPEVTERRAGSWPRTAAIVGAATAVVVLAGVLVTRADDPAPPVAAPPPGPAPTTATTAPAPVAPPDPAAVTMTTTPNPPAYADADWWQRYAGDMQYSSMWLDHFREAGFTKIKDGTTTYMTLQDGGRTTWRPPPCDCRRVTLWFYGSATGMGVGQRDDFTVASQLAQRAWRDGIAVDVVNRAMPGTQHWAQANHFAWDLVNREAPDVAVFYTGVTDLNAAKWLDEQRMGDRNWPIDTMTAGFMSSEPIVATVRQSTRGDATQPPNPPGVQLRPPVTVPQLGPEGIGRLTAERLNRTIPMGADLADRYDVRAFWFWEPMRVSRPPVEGEAVEEGDDDLRRMVATARAGLDPRIVDLGDTFVGVPRPLYFDFHFNEEGASLVADAIYEQVGPALRAAASG